MSFDYLIKGNNNKLSIKLKKTKEKGLSIFATKNIKKGDVIAFYKCKVFREKTYDSPTNNVYIFEIYKKNGDEYKRLIGDIYEESFLDPIENIPFWAPFVNEPSKHQRVNSEIDINTEENYKDKRFISPGDTIIYKLVATRKIRPGDEILLYYGKEYKRNYEVGKKY